MSKRRRKTDDLPTITEYEYSGKSTAIASVPMNDGKKPKYVTSPGFIIFMMLTVILYLSIWLYQQYNSDVYFRVWLDANQSSVELYSGLYFTVFIVGYVALLSKKTQVVSQVVVTAPVQKYKPRKVASVATQEVKQAQESLITEEAPPDEPSSTTEEETTKEEEGPVEVVPYQE